MPIFLDDIFGNTAEEKEQSKIAGKWKEAKKTMSYDSFLLMSRVISAPCVPTMMNALKDMMATLASMTAARKLEEVLRNISLGLSSNEGIPVEEMLKYVYSLVAENLPVTKVLWHQKKKKKKCMACNFNRSFHLCLCYDSILYCHLRFYYDTSLTILL